MRILEITPEWEPYIKGGIGVHVGALVRALNSQGHTARVCGVMPSDSSTDFTETELAVLSRSWERTNDPFGVRLLDQNTATSNAIARLTSREGALWDVVSLHHFNQGFSAISASNLLGAPLVWHAHGLYSGRISSDISAPELLVQALERNLTERAEAVICVSHYLAELLSTMVALDPAKVYVIPKGVDQADSHTRSRAQVVTGHVAFVGRLSPEKGLERLLDALPYCKHSSQIVLHLAGVGENETYVRSIREKLAVVQASGVTVVPHGFLSGAQLAQLYATVQAVVIPSLAESFGRVAIEAMNSGASVISSAAGGLPEVVRHGQTGIIFENGAALSSALDSLFSDAPTWAAMRHSAFDMVDSEFLIHDVVLRTLEAYAEVSS